ncbi:MULTISPECIES: DUF2510 domain-containing protein [unclassified Leifsonia]|uniref:DUF2510 domain-containing protein n=1 Tax=unclassified Leifsonia TaxID=2663824 RepID=UPI0008A7E59B|nr:MULTISPECIES: DUF2510 domain-containing protein [unclassified Leifsonia]SEI10020.1 Protein of unknown function [Leifsonia sp. CL154]SFL86815.1 Protein of unknown function [Leifsonia sp. CL147]
MNQTVPPGWYPDVDDPTSERWWAGESWSDARRPRGAAVTTTPEGQRGAELAIKLSQTGLWFCIAGTVFSIVGAGFTALFGMLLVGLLLFAPIATVFGIITIVVAARALGGTSGDVRRLAKTALVLGIVCTCTVAIAIILCVPLGILFHVLGAIKHPPF